MSNRALDYVMKLLEQTPAADVPPGARAVLWPLADRANKTTGATYAGHWLTKVSGLSPGSVRRYLHEMERRGWIRVEYAEKGKALKVTFPVVSGLSLAPPKQGRHDAGGQYHPPICGCPECAEMTGT